MPSATLPPLALRLLTELMHEADAEGLVVLPEPASAEPLCEVGRPWNAFIGRRLHLLPQPGATGHSRGVIGGGPVLAINLSQSDQSSGLLVLWRSIGSALWDARDLGLAAAAAAAVRVFLSDVDAQEPLSDLLDPVTGLPGRRVLLAEAERQRDRLDRDGLPGTLMLIEIDDLPSIERVIDPKAAERLLRQVGDRLRKQFRPGDLVGRIGRNGFAVWMPGADHLVAAERAEAIRAKPFAAVWCKDPMGKRTITVSAGIATSWPHTGQSMDALMQRARLATDRAQSNGGAQWCVAPSPSPPSL